MIRPDSPETFWERLKNSIAVGHGQAVTDTTFLPYIQKLRSFNKEAFELAKWVLTLAALKGVSVAGESTTLGLVYFLLLMTVSYYLMYSATLYLSHIADTILSERSRWFRFVVMIIISALVAIALNAIIAGAIDTIITSSSLKHG